MKLLWLESRATIPPRAVSLSPATFFLLLIFSLIVAADECQPATWENLALRAATVATITGNATAADCGCTSTLPTSSSSSPATPKPSKAASVARMGNVTAGEINCRAWSRPQTVVNYFTCTTLADRYEISVEKFFMLNPDVNTDCGNIQTNMLYCVAGFVEPVRTTDDTCGPPHNNATCLGHRQGKQCCNAQTWTCGNTTADCEPGTCYSGACLGDDIWSTDGTCGYQHGNRRCAGRWGDCCSMDGTCGTGDDFCGVDCCQSGNCTKGTTTTSATPPAASWLAGNSTDGTCGKSNRYQTCNIVFGGCCNKAGMCGSLPSDCGEGCQPEFGTCGKSNTTTTTTTSCPPTDTSTGYPTDTPTGYPTDTTDTTSNCESTTTTTTTTTATTTDLTTVTYTPTSPTDEYPTDTPPTDTYPTDKPPTDTPCSSSSITTTAYQDHPHKPHS